MQIGKAGMANSGSKKSPLPSQPRKPLRIRTVEFPDVPTPAPTPGAVPAPTPGAVPAPAAAPAAAASTAAAPGPNLGKAGSEDAQKLRTLLKDRIKKLARFGPTYGEDTNAISKVKDSAWGQITAGYGADPYIKVIKDMEKEVVDCYDDTGFDQKLKRGAKFRLKMARDGCFFLQLSLHILGGGHHLGYPEQNPYFGVNIDSTSWIPDMFFVGNQIPYIVIKALMEQDFFQLVIKEGVKNKTWKRPPADDLAKLALYLTVVEPHLENKQQQQQKKNKKKNPNSCEEASFDILQTLHNLILRSGSDMDDPTYQEMKEFQDLEANYEGKDVKIHSAGELQKLGIKLVKGEAGIPSIRFQNWGYSAFLYVPTLTIDAYTEVLLTSLASHELALRESEREVTAYLRFMRDLSPTYKDFKILEREGIIIVKDHGLKGTTLQMLDTIVSRHNSNFTLNFCMIRRQINDYGGPPWRLISFCLGLLTVVQTIFTILSYCIPPP